MAPNNPTTTTGYYYDLGSQHETPIEMIEKNYRALKGVWELMDNPVGREQLSRIEKAWGVISNPASRAAYDRSQSGPGGIATAVPSLRRSDAFASSMVQKRADLPIYKPPARRPDAAPSSTSTAQKPPTRRLDFAPISSSNAQKLIAGHESSIDSVRQLDELIRSKLAANVSSKPASTLNFPLEQYRTLQATQIQYTQELTKMQKHLDELHDQIHDIHFTYKWPLQEKGHFSYSRFESNAITGMNNEPTRKQEEIKFRARRETEVQKDAEITRILAIYMSKLDQYLANNKHIITIRRLQGPVRDLENELDQVEKALQYWLDGFISKDKARREGGERIRIHFEKRIQEQSEKRNQIKKKSTQTEDVAPSPVTIDCKTKRGSCLSNGQSWNRRGGNDICGVCTKFFSVNNYECGDCKLIVCKNCKQDGEANANANGGGRASDLDRKMANLDMVMRKCDDAPRHTYGRKQ